MKRAIIQLMLALGFLGSSMGVMGQTSTWNGSSWQPSGVAPSSSTAAYTFIIPNGTSYTFTATALMTNLNIFGSCTISTAYGVDLIISSTLTVDGSLTNNSTYKFNPPSKGFKPNITVINGTLVNSGDIVKSSGTITINTNGILTNNGGITIGNLILNSGGTINNPTPSSITIVSKMSIGGTFTPAIDEYSYILNIENPTNTAILEITNSKSVSISDIISSAAPIGYNYLGQLVIKGAASFTNSTDIVINTKLDLQGGTVNVNSPISTPSLTASGTNTITGSSTLSVTNQADQGAGTTTISSDLSVTNALVVNGGTWIFGNATSKTYNLGTLQLSNSGTFQSTASAATILNITTVPTIQGNLLLNNNTTVGTFPSSITVNGTNSSIDYLTAKYVNFISSATLGNATLDSMDISDGKTLTLSNPVTINKHVKVFLTGVLASGGNLTLNDGAALYFTNNNSVTGNVNIKRNLSYQGLTFFGPSLDFAVSNFGADWIGQYIESNNPGNGRFVQVTTGNLSRGTGYDRSTSAAREFTVTGRPDISNLAIPISYTTTNTSTSNGQRGFHLVSNPYTAPISIPLFLSNNLGLSQSIQLWDNNGDATGNGDYMVVDVTGLTTGGLNAGHIASAGKGYLAPQQGFFVKANGTGFSANFSGTQVTSALNNNFLKSAITQDYIRLNLKSASGLTNEMIVRFIEGATDDFDNSYDAYKLKGNTKISLYSKLSSDDMIIQSFAPLSTQKEVKIGVRAITNENYTFKVSDFSNIDPETRVYLKDIKAGKFIDLRAGDYTVQLSGDTIDSRFLLVFSKNDVTATKSISEKPDYNVYSSNNRWYIDFKKGQDVAKVQIFDIQGRIVYNEEVKHYVGSYPLNYNFKSNSVYILKVSSANSIYTQKIVPQ